MTPKGSALHVAVRMDLTEMVKMLLDNNANEHLKDENGDTPLELADSEAIQTLLHREDKKYQEKLVVNPFLPELLPVLKGSAYRQNSLYQMKQLFLVCDPFEGTLIRY